MQTRREFLGTVALTPLLGAAEKPAAIRVGCQTRIYGSPIRERARLLSVLEDLAAAGYEGFETNFASLEHGFDDPAPMRREIEKRGIALIGLHVSGGAVGDAARMEKQRAQVERVARAVRDLGGTHMVMSSARLPENDSETGAQRRQCEEINRAGKQCQSLGVRLCVHNHSHELAHGGRQIRAILEGTDPQFVSMLIDVGHVFPAEFTLADLVRGHQRRIAGFHLRDTVQGKEVLIGTGVFDFAALARLARETAWKGWLIVELNQRPDTPSRRLAEMARQHLRKTMSL